jgi:predicted nucleic acid-binding protein
MKAYWDSSALIKALHDQKLRISLKRGKDGTRPHSLAELFSTLTKGVNFHYSPADAAAMIESLAESLDFVELSAGDAVAAVKAASAHGVRGARIHDLMHAAAAQKYNATVLFTLDEAGFATLKNSVRAQAP